ncbi:hypothetical protein SAMN02745823_03037 [Sporobacter termitidis DSM 10068]|uniref:Glycosyl transferase family 2 n=1 Tax=Sporobacter termitidis DSM 10068 TaxID=1123282 RepID=A0A1M5Z084_9FIRM|nr:hypothetical protein [Sporobacter termitidis]SHI17692.1 hypothetical protein SAMN02745823_03037 [Sporobacter termitidis DSM 10068]
MEKNTVNVGIGFATGRKSFRQVARTYAENWYESGLADNKKISLNLFVAYDLNYKNTRPNDFTCLDARITDMLDYPFFIGDALMKKEAATLVSTGVINRYEAELLFGDGYAKKRNAIMYFAIKNHMDYLLFIDDDEYPLASIKTPGGIVWKGQHVLETHLRCIKNADITHGYHCGYVSPIPQLHFNDTLTESDFKLFIETISNDIINWDSLREKMRDGGVTYANEAVLNSKEPTEVMEEGGAKFISGSNLLIRLDTDKDIYPFFNPPGARGEDTFLGTCLSDLKVLKVPSYTFHDGFLSYPHLLYGTLPNKLKPVFHGDGEVDERFYKACVGWVRYKPLLLYITNRADYARNIAVMKKSLAGVLPKLCKYFGRNEFSSLLSELDRYSADVEAHYKMFEMTKAAWTKVLDYRRSQPDGCYRDVRAD